MSRGPVAIIDIGSNSIKLLVAGRDETSALASLRLHTIDARISAGISRERPVLGEAGQAAGEAAVRELLDLAAHHQPVRTVLVATSAVRDAANGADFVARIHRATGHTIRILRGDEEANLIGRGLTADPELTSLQDFYVFDLGGGSLECLSFRARRIQQSVSLPLGCVRLTERFVRDISGPFGHAEESVIREHVRGTLTAAGFRFDLTGATGVFAGGSMTTLRAVLGARTGLSLKQTPTIIGVAEIRSALACLGPMPLDQRRTVPGLPAARADVFPAALATLLAIAEAATLPAFRHSFYNLRWGLAAELLET